MADTKTKGIQPGEYEWADLPLTGFSWRDMEQVEGLNRYYPEDLRSN